jgi:hypothetical protein
LIGIRFDHVQSRLYNAVALGYRRGAQIRMNPPPESVLAADDVLLVLGDNPFNFHIGAARTVKPAKSIVEPIRKRLPPEFFVIIGYSSKVAFILNEYDGYVSPGSIIYLLSGMDRASMVRFFVSNAPPQYLPTLKVLPELMNIEIVCLDGDPIDSAVLATLIHLPHKPSCIIILAHEAGVTQREAGMPASRGEEFCLIDVRVIIRCAHNNYRHIAFNGA